LAEVLSIHNLLR